MTESLAEEIYSGVQGCLAIHRHLLELQYNAIFYLLTDCGSRLYPSLHEVISCHTYTAIGKLAI
jgi:hypothetical protein